MAKGLGLAAVQERIRKSFLDVHHDQRTREQREADEEMRASIAPSKSSTEALRTTEEQQADRQGLLQADESALAIQNDKTEKQVSACISAALRSSHIAKHLSLRPDIHHCYTVKEPSESADTLIAQALRQLEGK